MLQCFVETWAWVLTCTRRPYRSFRVLKLLRRSSENALREGRALSQRCDVVALVAKADNGNNNNGAQDNPQPEASAVPNGSISDELKHLKPKKTNVQDPVVVQGEAERNQEKKGRKLKDFPAIPFAGLNLFLLSCGVVGLIGLHAVQLSRKLTLEFLSVDPPAVTIQASLMGIASLLAIISGMTGILFAVWRPSLLVSVPATLNGFIMGVYILALMCNYPPWNSQGEDSVINYALQQRVLEAVAFTNGSLYFEALSRRYKGYWDRLQKTLGCCGLESAENWINSDCNCIPNTCCVISKRKQCEKNLVEWHDVNSPSYHKLNHIQGLVWSKNCREAITEERQRLEKHWFILMTTMLIFHLILSVSINYVMIAARNRYNMDRRKLLPNQSKFLEFLSGKFRTMPMVETANMEPAAANDSIGQTDNCDGKLESCGTIKPQ